MQRTLWQSVPQCARGHMTCGRTPSTACLGMLRPAASCPEVSRHGLGYAEPNRSAGSLCESACGRAAGSLRTACESAARVAMSGRCRAQTSADGAVASLGDAANVLFKT